MAPVDEEKPCETCRGTGRIYVDDMHSILCVCSQRRLFKAHLGPEIMAVRTPKDSPLYILGPERRKPTTDLTRTNLFLKSTWRQLLPHLKWTLYYKGLLFRFRVETDAQILDVRLGNQSAKLKTATQRENSKSINSLSDLVEGPDLLIVRLGKLGYRNIAAAGYVKEALMIRETLLKPTWLVEEPSDPFVPGQNELGFPLHFTYSEELAEYIWDNFDVLDLTDTTPEVQEAQVPESAPEEESPRVVATRPSKTETAVEELDLSAYDEPEKEEKSNKKWSKRRGGYR